MKPRTLASLLRLGSTGLAGCLDERSAPLAPADSPLLSQTAAARTTGKHIVEFTSNRVPADFTARVSAPGGTVEMASGRAETVAFLETGRRIPSAPHPFLQPRRIP